MRKQFTKGILVVFCPLLISCGDEPSSVTREEYVAQIARSACAYMYSCCTAKDERSFWGLFAGSLNATSEAECIVEAENSQIKSMNKSYPTDCWDGEGAAKCLELWNTLTKSGCARFSDLEGECSMTKGYLALGDQCSHDCQCIEGECINNYCVKHTTPTIGLFDGKDGTSCTSHFSCKSTTCVKGRCETLSTYLCDGK